MSLKNSVITETAMFLSLNSTHTESSTLSSSPEQSFTLTSSLVVLSHMQYSYEASAPHVLLQGFVQGLFCVKLSKLLKRSLNYQWNTNDELVFFRILKRQNISDA